MSIAHIDALIRSAEHDRALAGELRHAGDLPALVRIGAARGYDFTADELTTYFARMEPDELSDRELDLVSGGTGGLASEPNPPLKYKLDRCFVKSWSTSGDAD